MSIYRRQLFAHTRWATWLLTSSCLQGAPNVRGFHLHTSSCPLVVRFFGVYRNVLFTGHIGFDHMRTTNYLLTPGLQEVLRSTMVISHNKNGGVKNLKK